MWSIWCTSWICKNGNFAISENFYSNRDSNPRTCFEQTNQRLRLNGILIVCSKLDIPGSLVGFIIVRRKALQALPTRRNLSTLFLPLQERTHSPCDQFDAHHESARMEILPFLKISTPTGIRTRGLVLNKQTSVYGSMVFWSFVQN